MTETEVWSLLEQVVDPVLEQNIVDLGLVLDCQVDDGTVSLTVFHGGPGGDAQQAIADQVFNVLEGAGYAVELHAADAPVKDYPRPPDNPEAAIMNPDVANYIPVLGPKGGVGKTTIAMNLAVTLTERDIDTGIVSLDTTANDLKSFFTGSTPYIADADNEAGWEPATVNGLKKLSMRDLTQTGIWDRSALKTDESMAEIWQYLLRYPEWGSLDYLIVDMPPDAFGKLSQMTSDLPGPGVLLVTASGTPSLDAAKHYAMVAYKNDDEKIPFRVFGVVENKSGAVCPACQAVIDPPMEEPMETCPLCESSMDGELCPECWYLDWRRCETDVVDCPECGTPVPAPTAGGGRGLAKGLDVPFFGRIPRDPALRNGLPYTREPAVHRESPGAVALESLSGQVTDVITAHNRNTFSEWRAGTSDETVGAWIERALAAVEAEEPLTAPPVKA